MGPQPQDRPAEELFTRISPGRISGMIVEQIRSLIREGRLTPGDRLPSERDLAVQFGVSRVTVRDALRALEATGLVEIKVGANGGAFLRAPSSDVAGQGMVDMMLMSALAPEDVAEARLMLEVNTVMLAVRRATGHDIAELRSICDRAAELSRAGEYDVHLSWDFHDRLARATHNPAIELITRSFRGPLSLARARAREEATVAHERTVREHSELVDAIAARDAARAQEILAAHVVRATNLEGRLRTLGLSALGAALGPADPRAGRAGEDSERRNGPREKPQHPPDQEEQPAEPGDEPQTQEPIEPQPDPVDPLKRKGDREATPGLDPVVDPIPPG